MFTTDLTLSRSSRGRPRALPRLLLALTALAALTQPACDTAEGASLAGVWEATLVQGEDFPQVEEIEVGGTVQGPQTRTATLALYEQGKGDLLFETRFVSMLSKTENISHTIYDARITDESSPNFTLRLSREDTVLELQCARAGDVLECEQDADDPTMALWDFALAE